MKTSSRLFVCALLLGGCSELPRDADGTLDRVTRDGIIRVGLAEPEEVAVQAPVRAMLHRVSEETGARPRIVRGSLEPLLSALQEGGLDMVVAPFAADTPWATRISLAPPLAVAGRGDTRLELRAAMLNGENRWVMTVERATRAAAPEASTS